MTILCELFELSRAGYYACHEAHETARSQRDQELAPLVRSIFLQHRRRYGARRIAVELAAMGQLCGVERVAQLLKSQGLQAIQPRAYRPRTTDSRHTLGYSPNLLLSASSPVTINRVWVADITYIPLRTAGFAYLALVMDRFSRRVVGWQLANHMSESLVCQALRSAIRTRQPRAGLIHHSDRGGQYAGGEYRSLMRRTEMRQSMSRARNCYDNAFMESCFGTIKTELEMTEYDDIAGARRELASYLSYYNLERRHSSLDYLSPAAFEQLHTPPG